MSLRRVKPWRRSPAQHYRLRGWRRWLMWWMFGPLLLGGLVLATGPEAAETTAGAVLLLIAAAVLAAWEWICRRTTLETSAAGLRLRQVGYALETPWSNVAGFHAQPAHEGFVLAQPLRTAGARRLAGFVGMAGLHDEDQAGWIAAGRFIPIEAFGWHLRKGTLVADVSALAPHLAPAMHAANDPAPPLQPAQRRRHRILAASIGMLMMASLLLAWRAPDATMRAVDIGHALVMPLLALQSTVAAWRCACERRWLPAALMAAGTLIALGSCAGLWRALG